MTVGDQGWLPEAARARLARFSSSGTRTSLLPVAGATGIEAVGLTPVAEVMGCVVARISFTAGLWTGQTYSQGYRAYVAAAQSGYETAIARMTVEAAAMGADGVIGVRLTADRLDEVNREFIALGTAVRANSSQRPRRLFTAALSGQDVAKLMLAGWVPSNIAIGMAADMYWGSRQAIMAGWGNMEMPTQTGLVSQARHHAREQFTHQVSTARADGAIVSEVALRTWSSEDDNYVRLGAEADVFGTALCQFHVGHRAPSKTLTVMPLRSPQLRPTKRQR